jgi:hypothetical protein
MNPKLKNILIITLKNAVNAVLTNAALMGMLHNLLDVTTRNGWWNIGKVTMATVAAREAMIWVPELLKWSTSTSSTSLLNGGNGNAK